MQKNYLKISLFVLVFISLIVVGTIVFIRSTHHNVSVKAARIAVLTPVPVPQKVTDLLNTVSKQIQLPQGEIPSVATVSDVTKLPHEPFFANAQNGDKVLIYGGAGKAYLYRPSTGEIVAQSAVEVVNNSMPDASNSADLATPSGEVTPVLKIHY